jgi:hypothetical protein
MHYDLPAARFRLVGGHVVLPPGPSGPYRYLLAVAPLPVDGKEIARDRKAGLILYRLASAPG